MKKNEKNEKNEKNQKKSKKIDFFQKNRFFSKKSKKIEKNRFFLIFFDFFKFYQKIDPFFLKKKNLEIDFFTVTAPRKNGKKQPFLVRYYRGPKNL